MKPTVVTISGIRPDFIRMSRVFKLLDENFNHILIHSGQHYDQLLSGVFFEELEIRQPDYCLSTGKVASTHYEQMSYLSVEIFRLFERESIKPDLVVFLGDSNTVTVSVPLKKEGYKICHIEGGMRSYDKRMMEEINRTVCDHCSDIIMVYHPDYLKQLELENIRRHVYVVGNTITEICHQFKPSGPKSNDSILVDIHRPENFKHPGRVKNILEYANQCAERYGLPVRMLKFHGTSKCLEKYSCDLGKIQLVELLSFRNYLKTVYNCKFIISDSGTGQEEPAILRTPVIVPRDFTERPQSVRGDCSYMLDVNTNDPAVWNKSFEWLDRDHAFETDWLGDGHTAENIIRLIKEHITSL